MQEKQKLEMGIEDQKISFELFDEERTLLDQNVCLEVKESEEKVLRREPRLIWDDKDFCVKLMTLKERLLGGNPAPFFNFVFLTFS